MSWHQAIKLRLFLNEARIAKEEVPMSLENLYQKALKEITNHWDEVLKLSQDDRCGIQGPTGLNELSNWLHELVSKDGPQSMFLENISKSSLTQKHSKAN